LERTDEELSSSTGSDSEEEEKREGGTGSREPRKSLSFFRIPKVHRGKSWSNEHLENFRKNWPHLKNFDDSVLRKATLTELTAMGKQRISGSRLLSHELSVNFEQLQNFPVRVERGEDDCLGIVHPARFLRGYVGDSLETGSGSVGPPWD
jgi:hypothetical protein